MSDERTGQSRVADERASSAKLGAPSGASGQLWRALVALAAVPAPLKRKGAGTGAGRSENLVAEFDEAYTAFVDSFDSLPEESQLLTLQAMDRQLSSMVRAKDPELWTGKAQFADPHWVKVRDLAVDAIEAFGWPAGREEGVAGRLTLHEGDAE